ncbi:ASCH domain-containing protein [Nonomuraea sp. NPDC050556]|uniref:ASCH domain-containing protein n=1 Tax=Nonomuraea sp. NPDC050556 TaxID=3364369 RepID=UPI0037976516
MELGNPGEMRDRLTGLVVDGVKVATAGLADDYEDEELEHVGEHLIIVDSAGDRLCEIEVTGVEVVPFAEVTWEFAQTEGEGFRSIDHWREAHRRFFGPIATDDAKTVCIHFHVVG